jgi:Uma2 family endonuclease
MHTAASSASFSLAELLRFGPLEIRPRRMNEAQFLSFVQQHEDLRIEQNKNGSIYIMPPVGYDSGIRESHPYGALYAWWLTHQKGRVFSPSTMFRLPDGSKKMADGAWISEDKHKNLAEKEWKKIAAVVPDFVIEVRSETDDSDDLYQKMTETWLANGVQTAWLIDPLDQFAYVFRQGAAPEKIVGFESSLSAEPTCRGLTFSLSIMNL